MKQRTVMAISTVLNPKVIIADEPTSALDVVVQRQVMQTLGRLQGEIGSAVVLIGHDMGLIAQFADLIGVMYAGRLVEVGPVDDILSSPRHPYTRLLIDSLPKLTGKGKLIGIPGLPPALLSLPPGCAFHPRCPFAFDRCRVEIPLDQQVAPSRRVACHLYPEHAVLPPLPLRRSSSTRMRRWRRARRRWKASTTRAAPPRRPRSPTNCAEEEPVGRTRESAAGYLRPRPSPTSTRCTTEGTTDDGDAPARAAQRHQGLPERHPQDGREHDRSPCAMPR